MVKVRSILIMIMILAEIGILLPLFISNQIPAFLNNQLIGLLFIIFNLSALFMLFL